MEDFSVTGQILQLFQDYIGKDTEPIPTDGPDLELDGVPDDVLPQYSPHNADSKIPDDLSLTDAVIYLDAQDSLKEFQEFKQTGTSSQTLHLADAGPYLILARIERAPSAVASTPLTLTGNIAVGGDLGWRHVPFPGYVGYAQQSMPDDMHHLTATGSAPFSLWNSTVTFNIKQNASEVIQATAHDGERSVDLFTIITASADDTVTVEQIAGDTTSYITTIKAFHFVD